MSKLFRMMMIPTALILLSSFVCAEEMSVTQDSSFCFSADDFSVSDTDEGIFITSVPSKNIAHVRYGNRTLQAGDALTTNALNEITLETSCVTEQSIAVEYCTVADGKITGVKSLKMAVHPKKNDAPIAKNSQFETYKNISNSGKLDVSDPEGASMIYTLIDPPKRGTVEISEDGTFTYTPNKNKVGKDSFTYTATDNAGNISDKATVSIVIRKPDNKTTYSDMQQDPDHFVAMWLKDKNLFTGSTIGGNLCFEPDKSVSRGEFLVMAMKLVGADKDMSMMTSGFADESETPSWMQPYISRALSNGMISGTASEGGAVFRPNDMMEKAEAIVMIQNILDLPSPDATAVFNTNCDSVPTWAVEAFQSLSQAGIDIDFVDNEDMITRRDAALLLYQIDQLLHSASAPKLYWMQ